MNIKRMHRFNWLPRAALHPQRGCGRLCPHPSHGRTIRCAGLGCGPNRGSDNGANRSSFRDDRRLLADQGWRTSTPEEQGMDSQKLAAMLAEIKERNMNVHSFLVIRNGYLVSETYFDSYQPDAKQDMQSVGRSFTPALVGIAIDKGYIDGVDHRILRVLPEAYVCKSGHAKGGHDAGGCADDAVRPGTAGRRHPTTRNAMQNSPDWVQFLLDKPVAIRPEAGGTTVRDAHIY